MKEIHRIMKKDARAYLTFYIYDEESRQIENIFMLVLFQIRISNPMDMVSIKSMGAMRFRISRKRQSWTSI